jgi:hypothetical protein
MYLSGLYSAKQLMHNAYTRENNCGLADTVFTQVSDSTISHDFRNTWTRTPKLSVEYLENVAHIRAFPGFSLDPYTGKTDWLSLSVYPGKVSEKVDIRGFKCAALIIRVAVSWNTKPCISLYLKVATVRLSQHLVCIYRSTICHVRQWSI